MGWFNNIFQEINLRFFSYSSHPQYQQMNNEIFIEHAVSWFRHSMIADGECASKYSMLWNKYFPPLPESVAGWIKTLFDVKTNYPELYNKLFTGNPEERLTHWLLSVQRPDGTFASSYEDPLNQPPSVFVNGSILSGLISVYDENKNAKVLDAIMKCAHWLIQLQQPDGCWRHFTFNAPFANTMSALALIRLGKMSGEKKFILAGTNNIAYTVSRQNQNGSFTDNSDKNTSHYSDVIAFTLLGILTAADKLNDDSLLEAVLNGYKPLFYLLKKDGYLPGEIDNSFQTSVNYCCLPGNCLMSIIGNMLYHKTGKEIYKTAAERMLQYVKEKQLRSRYNYLGGGITGSWPISGRYNPYEIHSSAVRYFVDALIMQEQMKTITV